MKKTGAIVITVIIAAVWYISALGIGPVGPIQDKISLGLDIKGGVYVVMEAQTDATGSELQGLMEQTQARIERRVNEMGLSEPTITIEGEKRIRVELPGAEDPESAIRVIGQTAQLQFKTADGEIAVTGDQVKDSQVRTDSQHGGYEVTIDFDSAGGTAFGDATTKAYNQEFESPFMDGIDTADQIAIVLDDEIISAPNVNEPITGGTC